MRQKRGLRSSFTALCTILMLFNLPVMSLAIPPSTVPGGHPSIPIRLTGVLYRAYPLEDGYGGNLVTLGINGYTLVMDIIDLRFSASRAASLGILQSVKFRSPNFRLWGSDALTAMLLDASVTKEKVTFIGRFYRASGRIFIGAVFIGAARAFPQEKP